MERCSVAICTYQGERYVEELLASLAAQSRPPDEVVVCDDGSTDATVAVVERFARGASFPVLLHVNREQLGPTKNFEAASARCRGEAIFLADQDDVWLPHKLSKLMAALSAAPRAGLVFCDAEIVDEHLFPRGRTLWQVLGFGPAEQRRFVTGGVVAQTLKQPVTAGMTLGFRARFRDLLLPFPPDCVHDIWIPLVLGAVADAALVPECLVKWRQHEAQLTGEVRIRSLRRRWSESRLAGAEVYLQLAELHRCAFERLRAHGYRYAPAPEPLALIEGKIAHVQARADMRRDGKRLALVAREVRSGNYARYSRGWRSVAKDLVL